MSDKEQKPLRIKMPVRDGTTGEIIATEDEPKTSQTPPKKAKEKSED